MYKCNGLHFISCSITLFRVGVSMVQCLLTVQYRLNTMRYVLGFVKYIHTISFIYAHVCSKQRV